MSSKFNPMQIERRSSTIIQKSASLCAHQLTLSFFIWLWFLPNWSSGQCAPTCFSTNIYLGTNSGEKNSSGRGNTFIGHASGTMNTSGDRNSFFGQSSGLDNTTGNYNSFFGEDAGLRNTTGSQNSFFGQDAGSSNIVGKYNSFFGQDAGKVSFSSYNSFFGQQAGASNTLGSDNSFFGHKAGVTNLSGNFNAFFGLGAGLTNRSGSRNSFFGHLAGNQIKTGDGNICIGAQSGPNFDSSHVSYRLFIDIQESNDPLIYGEFDNDLVRINGEFEVMTGLSNPSSILLKDKFRSVGASDILKKVSQLTIEEWSYKHQPDVRHIGPVAEQFAEAFGLGNDSTKISTIDADGIALLSIQALNEQLKEMKQENQYFKDQLKMFATELRSLKDKIK